MNLLTIDDIAAMFRRKRRTVAEEWVPRPDFPAPHFAPTSRSRLWLAEDVMRWARRETPQSAPQSRGSTPAPAGQGLDAR